MICKSSRSTQPYPILTYKGNSAGSTVVSSLQSTGMDTSLIRRVNQKDGRTAQYVAVNDGEKNLVMAMADMDIFTTHAKSTDWETMIAKAKPKWLVVDANWTPDDIRLIARAGKQSSSRVAYEPVSVAKSSRLFGAINKSEERLGVFPIPSIDLATPNKYELASMYAAAQQNMYFEDSRWWEVIDSLGMTGARDRFVKITSMAMTDAGIPQQTIQLLPYIPTIITKLGEQGALLTMLLTKEDPHLYDSASEPFILTRSFNNHPNVGGVYMRLFPAAERVDEVVSVNGVGDTFLGVMVAGLARGGKGERLVDVAQQGAVMTLKSSESVSEDLGALESRLDAAVAGSKRS
jgi:pseudouridylate synthase / pseudouridine kinase